MLVTASYTPAEGFLVWDRKKHRDSTRPVLRGPCGYNTSFVENVVAETPKLASLDRKADL